MTKEHLNRLRMNVFELLHNHAASYASSDIEGIARACNVMRDILLDIEQTEHRCNECHDKAHTPTDPTTQKTESVS